MTSTTIEKKKQRKVRKVYGDMRGYNIGKQRNHKDNAETVGTGQGKI